MKKNKKKLEAFFKEAKKSVEAFRAQKISEAMIKLGFNFKTQEELDKFKRERITVGIVEGKGKIIFLDHNKPNQIILAFYSDHPEEIDGKIAYRDNYYEGPDTEQPNGEAILVNIKVPVSHT